MRALTKWLTLLLTALLTLSLVPFAAAQQTSQPAAGRDQVVIGLQQEPDSLNPLFATMAASVSVMSTIFTSDVQRDNTWKLFAQGVTYLPNLKDGTWKLDGDKMTLVWRVKPRTWSDGRPVTCGDYVFGHNVARNPLVPVVVRDLTDRISNILCTAGASGHAMTVTGKSATPTRI